MTGKYRLLQEGEIVLATDEYLSEKGVWVPPNGSVGNPVPNPNYTSHRQFRRLVSEVKTVKIRWFKDREGKDFALPSVVEDSIRKSFAHSGKVEEILDSLHYNTLGRYFSFIWCGMYIGCELDGYIHS